MEAEALSSEQPKGKMEAETLSTDHTSDFLSRALPAVVPVLLISIGYVDPGKWVASVEGGARFGLDLVAFTLIFNFAAIFCQYLSARVGVITGRDLAQICSDEYDTWTCLLLGIQTELSVIMLDLNMVVFLLLINIKHPVNLSYTWSSAIYQICFDLKLWFKLFCKILGMAQGLNLIFGWDLFTCVFLTATGAVFHILLAVLLDIEKAKFLGQFVAGFVLLSFILGILVNQSEVPLSMNGMLLKLSGESAFMLMSLLGATLVPHNFYLHSSIVQVLFPLILNFHSCKCSEMFVSCLYYGMQPRKHLLFPCERTCMDHCLTSGVYHFRCIF